MKTKANKSILIAFVVVIVLFLFFGGWGMTEGIMNGGMHSGMNETGWMDGRAKLGMVSCYNYSHSGSRSGLDVI
jgi:hypothetical protein